jgi:Tfp pilus assembly protein FimT
VIPRSRLRANIGGRRRESGVALVDLLCATGLMAVLGAMSVPSLGAWMDRDRARLSARYLAGKLHHARMEALKRNAEVAVRFGEAADGYPFSIFVDGNDNGVLERDIADGIDTPVLSTDRLSDHFSGVTLRVVESVPNVETSETVAAGADPLRIGRSRLVSFSPSGTCTSGSIFIAGISAPQAAVRMLGATGRLRVLWFDAVNRTWRPD